jgi:hypothetical protein
MRTETTNQQFSQNIMISGLNQIKEKHQMSPIVEKQGSTSFTRFNLVNGQLSVVAENKLDCLPTTCCDTLYFEKGLRQR